MFSVNKVLLLAITSLNDTSKVWTSVMCFFHLCISPVNPVTLTVSLQIRLREHGLELRSCHYGNGLQQQQHDCSRPS